MNVVDLFLETYRRRTGMNKSKILDGLRRCPKRITVCIAGMFLALIILMLIAGNIIFLPHLNQAHAVFAAMIIFVAFTILFIIFALTERPKPIDEKVSRTQEKISILLDTLALMKIDSVKKIEGHISMCKDDYDRRIKREDRVYTISGIILAGGLVSITISLFTIMFGLAGNASEGWTTLVLFLMLMILFNILALGFVELRLSSNSPTNVLGQVLRGLSLISIHYYELRNDPNYIKDILVNLQETQLDIK